MSDNHRLKENWNYSSPTIVPPGITCMFKLSNSCPGTVLFTSSDHHSLPCDLCLQQQNDSLYLKPAMVNSSTLFFAAFGVAIGDISPFFQASKIVTSKSFFKFQLHSLSFSSLHSLHITQNDSLPFSDPSFSDPEWSVLSRGLGLPHLCPPLNEFWTRHDIELFFHCQSPYLFLWLEAFPPNLSCLHYSLSTSALPFAADTKVICSLKLPVQHCSSWFFHFSVVFWHGLLH